MLVSLLLAALYAGSAIAASTALYAERAAESITVIPIVGPTGVYAEIVNSGSQAARVLYVVSRNLTGGALTVVPVNASLDPGGSITVKLADASGSGRLAAYAVSALGGVYPWDPRYTLDGVLDLPQEPLNAGAGLGEDALSIISSTAWLVQFLGPDYPGICTLETVYVNPNVTVNIPYTSAYGRGFAYTDWYIADAEASARAGNVSSYMRTYRVPTAEARAWVSYNASQGGLGPLSLSLLVNAEAWGYASLSPLSADAWARANASLLVVPPTGYAAVIVARPASATGGASVKTVYYGGYKYNVVVAQPGSPASFLLLSNYTKSPYWPPVGGIATAYAEATLPQGPQPLSSFFPYFAVYVFRCP